MILPEIRFGPDCDNFSLFAVLDLLNSGHRALEPENGDVYLEFVLADGTVLPGAYAGHDNDDTTMIVQLWNRQWRIPTDTVAHVPVDDIVRIDYP